MFKHVLALLLATTFSLSANAADSAFGYLRVGDVPAAECGTYVVDKGQEPAVHSMRMFMSTERTLYLRTDAGLRTLELVRADQKMRDPLVLGRGDLVTLIFSGQGSETATLLGTVSVAVIDDDGTYPILELDAQVSYTSPAGKTSTAQLTAHDLCL